MNFAEQAAAYILGRLTYTDLPNIAKTAIEEGYKSESLFILAGIENNESAFVKDKYWQKAIRELNLLLPTETKAKKAVLEYYAKQIVYYSSDPYDTIHRLEESSFTSYENWESLGLEHVYTLYYELWEYVVSPGKKNKLSNR